MYQYSLQYFVKLFNLVLEKSEKNDDVKVRVDTLIRVASEDIYSNVCRGLFEKDKKMFSFLIYVDIEKQSGNITAEEWQYFLTRGGMFDESKLPTNPATDCLSTNQWAYLVALDNIKAFEGFRGSFESNLNEWKGWLKSDDPGHTDLPGRWNTGLNNYQKLLVMRALREEKVAAGMADLVLTEMGKHYITSPPFDLNACYNDSTPLTPIIFVLSAGADPITYLMSLANEMGYGNRLHSISLGQGQGPLAQQMIQSAREAGDWVCLQNCHLSASWMPELDRILESHQSLRLHDDFRLWLTSMPSKVFPVAVLQNGVKITQEPPRGCRSNLTATYGDMAEDVFDGHSKPDAFKKLTFALSFFHAALQERRKFGPIGFNTPYEWNLSDLRTAQANVRMYVEEQPEVPWTTLLYIVGEVNYGGRVTDYLDQRCVHCIIENFFTPKLLDDDYRFTSDGVYYAPPSGDLASYKAYIDQLPFADAPEVFGLHSNAGITFEFQTSAATIDTIIDIMPRGAGGGGGKTPDEIVADIASEFSSKLPHLLDKGKAHADTFKRDENGTLSSLGTFLSIEMLKFNKMIGVMKKSLNEIQRAIKGFVVMSAELEDMYNAFLVQRVPGSWSKVSSLSLKPLGSWFKDIVAKVEFMISWIEEGPPAAFWVSAFFFPQGFLTAALQTYARRTATAIDTLDFATEVCVEQGPEDVTAPHEDGVYTYGCFMEGAQWDRSKMNIGESQPGTLFTTMPCILLLPIIQSKDRAQQERGKFDPETGKGYYVCPFYKVSTRRGTLSTTGHSTNYVRSLDIPCDRDPTHWVRRGVALLSQLDD